MSARHRTNTLIQLDRLGITHEDARQLCRDERVLHTWAENECNGYIQRDDETGIAYRHYGQYMDRRYRTADRETGAIKRVQAIAARYGLTAYHQTDPRGCAVYLLRPGDVPDGADVSGYYSRGVAVVS
jgi:hypothetical protein